MEYMTKVRILPLRAILRLHTPRDVWNPNQTPCALALATAAFVFADVRLTHMDVPLFDHGMASPVVSFIVTIFAISGVTHAVNISDGAHGLAAGISAMSMMSMAAIAFLSGDTELGILLAVIGAATLGFLIVNFPCGWLFLGDGGAYLLGFSSACTAVLLVERNPDVSPWAPLVLLAYPVWETLFSVGRRMTLERARATDPDGLHLHSLIMKSLWRRFGTHENRNLLNALSAVPILVVTAVLSGVVLSNYADTRSLEAVIILFISGYVSAYLFTRRTVRDGVLALATKRRMHARPMQMQRRSTLRGFTASGTDNPVGNVRNSSPRR